MAMYIKNSDGTSSKIMSQEEKNTETLIKLALWGIGLFVVLWVLVEIIKIAVSVVSWVFGVLMALLVYVVIPGLLISFAAFYIVRGIRQRRWNLMEYTVIYSRYLLQIFGRCGRIFHKTKK